MKEEPKNESNQMMELKLPEQLRELPHMPNFHMFGSDKCTMISGDAGQVYFRIVDDEEGGAQVHVIEDCHLFPLSFYCHFVSREIALAHVVENIVSGSKRLVEVRAANDAADRAVNNVQNAPPEKKRWWFIFRQRSRGDIIRRILDGN